MILWEECVVGDEIPVLTATIGSAQLFMMSAVTLNPHRIHYDEGWARHEGYEERVIHGPFHGEVIVQTIQNWLGGTGWLKELEYSNRRYAVLGDELTGHGRISRVYVEEERNLVDLEVWVENQRGETTAPGTAIVVLPSRDTPIRIDV